MSRKRTRPAAEGHILTPRLPPLTLVRAFEAVAAAGSMRKAADAIHISHTVVSRHVRNLEAWMGTKLITAGPRGVELTEEGRLFHSAVSKAFGLISDATQALMPLARRGTLRIWCMPGLATRWLTPRFHEIEQVVPGNEVMLRAVDRFPDIVGTEADLMICFGDPDDTPAGSIPLVRPRMYPVASPQWLADNPRPDTLEELAKCPLIHEESRQQWKDWFDACGIRLEHPLRGPRLWDASLGFDAAVAGLGIALATSLTTSDEMSNGRLVELFATNIHLGAYYLVVRPDRAADPLIGRFRDWLIANMLLSEAATRDHRPVHNSRIGSSAR